MAYHKETTAFGCLIIYAGEAVAGYKGSARWFGQVRQLAGRENGKPVIRRNWIEFSGKDDALEFAHGFRVDAEKAIRDRVTKSREKLTDRRACDFADDSGDREAAAERDYAAGGVIYI